jgi:exosortase
MLDRSKIATTALVLAGLGVLYRDVLPKLIGAWRADDNYAHGYLIIPVAVYLAWAQRARLTTAALRPSAWGLVVIGGSVLVLGAGLLGSELFLSRLSILGVLAGIVLFLFGWTHLRILAFPIAFLLLMIPMPAIIFNRIALPLQLLASQVGEAALTVLRVPVVREGNVLVLAHTTLEVAEACSGIRSLISLLAVAIVFGYFADRRPLVRTLVALSSIPVAILVNAARVAGTGVAAHHLGPAVAEGFFHDFSGWVLFVGAFAMMAAVQRAVAWIAPASAEKQVGPAPA